MKILGIGVDIENVERFQGLTIKNDGRFLNKIYTKNELKYCFSRKNSAQHLAVRFAGKEAVIKALSKNCNKTLSIKEIVITNIDNGSPVVKIPYAFSGGVRMHISLSHCQNQAIAFVVIQEIGGQ